MQTPQKVTLKGFQEIVDAFFSLECEPLAWKCKKCGSTIWQATAFMSLHDAVWADSCAGSGEVKMVAIPYCPKCEVKPAESGCLHR